MRLGRKEIGHDKPTYFIADLASNHDGSFTRAERLIYLAAEAGADAVKMQNFKAETIVSDYGFQQLGKLGHQEDWHESVYSTYERYQVPLYWTDDLKRVADTAGVDYLTTPYDIDILDQLAGSVCAWKVGSGDITYTQLIEAIIDKDEKPVLIGTGASSIDDIERVVEMIAEKGQLNRVILMQCNTNYTASASNMPYINLRTLLEYQNIFGFDVVGLSDHTHDSVTVLGAVALGARVIEKHFTDDNSLPGPDHSFSMNPISWSDMVSQTRELEAALGNGLKVIEDNEKETVILQRRALRATRDISLGEIIAQADLAPLRPCPSDALPPYRMEDIVGRECKRAVPKGDYVRRSDLTS